MIVDEDDHNVPVGRTVMRALRSVEELREGAALSVGLAVFAALGRISIPLLLRRAIDHGFPSSKPGEASGIQQVDVGYIGRLSVVGLVIAILTTLAASLSGYRLQKQSERGLAALRRRVADRILALSIGQHGQQRRGVLVARVTSDVETLSQFFGWSALAWVLQTATLIVVGVTMFVVNWRLALVAVLTTLPILAIFRKTNRIVVPIHFAVREHVGQYLGGVSELISAAPVIRAFGAQQTIGDRVLKAVQLRRKTSKRADLLSSFIFITTEAFIVIVLGAVLWAGLRWKSGAGLTAGTLVSFVFLVREFLGPLMDFTEIQDSTNRAAAGVSRILDLIDMDVDVPPPTHPVQLPIGALSVALNNVDYEYPQRGADDALDTQTFALRDINLVIAAGETVAIVGSTGSGKSTLAKLIVRTADPTTGSVTLGGVPINQVANDELRARLQLVPQEPFLFDNSLAHNIAIAATGNNKIDVAELVAGLGLDDWLSGLPQGLQTQVGERGDLLSAGERQLVALARARAADPDVIVLDEATSSVDAATEARLADTLDALAAGRTTIIIAHRLTTVARADRVVVMDAGRIIETGSPTELAAIPGGHYAQLVAAWERDIELV
jgi:ATP-binding cassette, subfamily B, bacterial